MDQKSRERYASRAQVIKAIAHPSRLFIIEELSKGERCVCELTEMIGADISTVSKHLSLLKAAGLVKDDKRGLQIFYRLHCPCILDFLACIETIERSTAQTRWKLARVHTSGEPARMGTPR